MADDDEKKKEEGADETKEEEGGKVEATEEAGEKEEVKEEGDKEKEEEDNEKADDDGKEKADDDEKDKAEDDGKEKGDDDEEEIGILEEPKESSAAAPSPAGAAAAGAPSSQPPRGPPANPGPLMRPLPPGSTSNSLSNVLIALQSLGLKYTVRPQNPAFPGHHMVEFPIGIRSGKHRCFCALQERESMFILWLRATIEIPVEQCPHAAHYFTLVNFGLALGNFELNLRDGVVRFKNSCFYGPGNILIVEQVRHLMNVAVSMMDRAFPGLMAVVYANKDPRDAYNEMVRK